MLIHINVMSTTLNDIHEVITVDVDNQTTAGLVRRRIAEKLNIYPDQLKLTHMGDLVDDSVRMITLLDKKLFILIG